MIEDGKGRGFQAEVNAEQELVVRSINETELEHASGKLGTAYSWDSGERNIDAGDTMLFVKNLSPVPLILDRIIINGSNVICTWDINIGANTTTPSGSAVTGVNINETFSSRIADAISFFDETAIADGATIFRYKTPVANTIVANLDGVILGKNHYIQINQETASSSGSVIVVGHFEVIS